jgi:CRISPR-associated helicase Cas3
LFPTGELVMDSFIVKGNPNAHMENHTYKNRRFKKFYPHQISFFENFGNNILMKAGTGSGKTLSAVLPIIMNNLNAIFVYPTNALIYDQKRAITDICNYVKRNYSIKIINSAELDKIQEKYRIGRHDAVINALQPDFIKDENRIVLTNPDIIFWLLRGAYRRGESVLRMRTNFDCFVFDEIHAYKGKEYANILFEIKFIAQFFNQSVYMLSATVKPGFEDVLSKNVDLDFIQIPESGRVYGKSYDIEVFLHPREKKSLADQIVKIIRNGREFEKTVIIVNSVLDAEITARQLENEFSVTEWHGLCSQRSLDGEIVVGTNAIELGIDFDCDRLIFETTSYESFIQRFGRAGRHSEGSVAIILPSLYAERIKNSFRNENLNRANFENIVYNFFGQNRLEASFFGSKFSAAEHKAIMEWFGLGGKKIKEFVAQLHGMEETQWKEIERVQKLLKDAEFLKGKGGFRVGGKNALIHILNKDEILFYDFFWCLKHETPQWKKVEFVEARTRRRKKKITEMSKYGELVAKYKIPFLEKNYNAHITFQDVEEQEWKMIEEKDGICLYYGTIKLGNGIRYYDYRDIVCATTRVLREHEIGYIQNCFGNGDAKIIFGDEALYVYSTLMGSSSPP